MMSIADLPTEADCLAENTGVTAVTAVTTPLLSPRAFVTGCRPRGTPAVLSQTLGYAPSPAERDG
jgi:hypothetical protein